MYIPFVDLRAQYQTIKLEIDRVVDKVFSSGQFIGGVEVDEFEKKFARFVERDYCVSLGSGTDALILGIRGLDLSIGSEVLIAANSYYASALCIVENGLKPVFVDAEEKDFGINLADLKRKITSRTAAIILVHLYGQSDKIGEIIEIIKKTGRKIYLIEDAAHAHGALYNGQPVGSFGVFAAFSFYPGKNLGAYGDGGAIVTSSRRLNKKYRQLRDYGQIKKYYHQILGRNSRLDSLQAAILSVKLSHLKKWTQKRQQIAQSYDKLLAKIPEIKTPPTFKNRPSVYHLYIIRSIKRAKLQKYLAERGISTIIHYPLPLHRQKAYRYLGYRRGQLPVAEKIASEILSLPIYPEMTKRQIKYICAAVANFYGKK